MTRREEPIPALSAGLSHVVLTGLFLALAFLPHRPLPFVPPATAPASPDVASRDPVTAAPAPAPAAPALAPKSSEPSAAPPPVDVAEAAPVEQWPAEEIARGREQCMHLLSSTAAEIEWLEPVKKGACGLPAPVALKSLGSAESKVVFDPPVQVNCRMVAALGAWLKTSVQPKAEDRFKSRVVRIRSSGYSCRNIYNRPNARLSQHALANAIDIGGFMLANGRSVGVLNGWGLTQRDIKARAKAKAEALAKAAKEVNGKKKDAKEADDAKAKGERTQDAKTADIGPKGKALLDQAGKNVTRASLTPPLTKTPTSAATPDGKAAPEGTPDVPAKPTREALFLRDIHGGACGHFGTVLGPEANDPHRNHFHLDLIPRQSRGYCQ